MKKLLLILSLMLIIYQTATARNESCDIQDVLNIIGLSFNVTPSSNELYNSTNFYENSGFQKAIDKCQDKINRTDICKEFKNEINQILSDLDSLNVELLASKKFTETSRNLYFAFLGHRKSLVVKYELYVNQVNIDNTESSLNELIRETDSSMKKLIEITQKTISEAKKSIDSSKNDIIDETKDTIGKSIQQREHQINEILKQLYQFNSVYAGANYGSKDYLGFLATWHTGEDLGWKSWRKPILIRTGWYTSLYDGKKFIPFIGTGLSKQVDSDGKRLGFGVDCSILKDKLRWNISSTIYARSIALGIGYSVTYGLNLSLQIGFDGFKDSFKSKIKN